MPRKRKTTGATSKDVAPFAGTLQLTVEYGSASGAPMTDDPHMRRHRDKAPAVVVIEELLRVIDMLMPGVGAIAVNDYALINEAPIRARRWLEAQTLKSL